MLLDASEIVPGLYQGSAPIVGTSLRDAGFDTLVLCAEEWQPPHSFDPVCSAQLGYWNTEAEPYPGINLIHAPNDDNFSRPPTREQLRTAIHAALQVAARIREGKKVLVTCWAGKNRSGMVSGIALHKITGAPGAECVSMIKRARPIALTNPQFIEALNRIQAKGVGDAHAGSP